MIRTCQQPAYRRIPGAGARICTATGRSIEGKRDLHSNTFPREERGPEITGTRGEAGVY